MPRAGGEEEGVEGAVEVLEVRICLIDLGFKGFLVTKNVFH